MTKFGPDKSQYRTDEQQQELADAIDEALDSGDFNAHVKAEHFAKGIPIAYIDDDEPDFIVTEYPDGKIERERIKE